MPSNIYPAVTGYRDGQEYKLNAEELNKPVNALKARTDWLKERVDKVSSEGGFSSIENIDVQLYDAGNIEIGMPVYIRPEDGKYAAATATLLSEPAFVYTFADTEAFAVGCLKSKSGDRGVVVTFGRFELTGVNIQSLMEYGEVFRPGPYYLSNSEPGKFTAAPTGPAVYLGWFGEAVAQISPQMKDLLEAHLHRAFVLADRPAGTIVQTGVDESDFTYEVTGYLPDYYKPGELGEGLTPGVLLNIRGNYEGSGSPTYTFWLTSPAGEVETAKIHWTTDDNSDDNEDGVVIGAFETSVELGNGLSVILEKGDPDYSLADFSVLTVVAALDPETTWTFTDFAEATRGWASRRVREDMVFTEGGATPSDCPIKLFGTYANVNKVLTERIKIVADNTGDLAVGDVDFTVYDIDDTIIDSVVSNQVNTAQVLSNGLWLMIMDGTVTSVTAGDTWEVTFVDEAPGAHFEYLTGIDRVMSAYYPPNPQLDLVLEANGVTLDVRNEFRDSSGTYTADARTIHWFGNEHRSTPFPFDYVDLSDRGEAENAKNIKLYGTTLRAASTGLVTSLESAEGSQIEVVDAITGLPATTGNLRLRASFGISVQDTNKEGYNVLKGVNESGELIAGPVVEKLVPGNNITLTPISGSPTGQGVMRISAAAEGFTRSLFTDIVLHNAKQELVPQSQIPFIKLKGWNSSSSNNIPSGFTMKFRVPYTLTEKYKMELYFTMFGLSEVAVGSAPASLKYAGLKLTDAVVPDLVSEADPVNPSFIARNLRDIGPTGVLKNEIVISNDIPFGKTGSGYVAYDPFLVHNSASLIPVDGQVVGPFGNTIPKTGDDPLYLTAGDIVTVRIDRQSPLSHVGASEYQGEIGFIANEWKLLEV
jgi:hypothetical protein